MHFRLGRESLVSELRSGVNRRGASPPCILSPILRSRLPVRGGPAPELRSTVNRQGASSPVFCLLSPISTVKVTGKGIYAGETGNVTFTLNVNVNDFDTLSAAGNGCPHGIWSDGTTMWVSDLDDRSIYAYNMATKAHDSSKDFNTTTLSAAGNRDTQSIWSDGTTMWVVDWTDDKIYAYSLSTKAHSP